MIRKCSCEKDCYTTFENLSEKIENMHECENCKDIQIKKFTPLKDLIDFNELTGDYKRCECSKRPLDIVMSHILKVMIEEEIVPEKATLRRNSPVPLSEFYYSSFNPQFINENSLILLHPELLEGCDIQTNVMRTLINEKIIINKQQSKHHIEVATTTESKLIKLHNYLNNNNIKKGIAVDAMCGSGAIGTYLLKYGFEKVIFNDIYPEAIENLKETLEVNGINEGYEIYNEAFEDLEIEHADLCVIDAFPKDDTSEIIKKAEKIADTVLVI